LYGYFTSNYQITNALMLDVTGTYTGSMVVPRVVSESGYLDLVESDPFLDVNLKASYRFNMGEGFNLELSGGVKNIFNSFQQDFESGPERDSDFVFGPMAPRSFFVSLRIGNL
jgi:outer membrane receptor for ferrienterochelin and colicins